MNSGTQTLREGITRKESLVHPRKQIRVACWNVRTMYAPGKAMEIDRAMDKFNIDILGVSECRWLGAGKVRLSSGSVVLYSGMENVHERGVAVIIKSKHSGSLMEWEPVNERIIRARFFSRHIKLTVIQCYAPTNDASEEEKEAFYLALHDTTAQVPKHDMLVVLGDLNAKVGTDNKGFEESMGCEECGNMNDNGSLFRDFCQDNSLVIGGTIFPHKDIHKVTWMSPDGSTKNQIDHITITKRFRRSLIDVRAYRSADIGSDHELVLAKVRLKLCRQAPSRQREQRYEIRKLKDPKIAREFRLELRNRFQPLADLDGVEETWQEFKKGLDEASRKVLGLKERKRAVWISDESWEKIRERSRMKNKMNTTRSERLKDGMKREYRKLHRGVRYGLRSDKRKYLDGLAKEAEEAARRGEQGTLYAITRRITNSKFKRSVPVRSKEGVRITSESGQIERWKQHFEEVLNLPGPQNAIDETAKEELDINTEPPSVNEIIRSLKVLRNGKVPGIDNIQAEVLKLDVGITADALEHVFTRIWKEVIPGDWQKGVIVKVPKKGNLEVCDNWRGVALLSVPGKVLCRIIIDRIKGGVDGMLRKEQGGFRTGRSCIDQIFVLRNIIEQCVEWNSPLFINFVDFRKAFDSVHRESLWNIMSVYGIPRKLITMVKLFYNNFMCSVEHEGRYSEWFVIESGVRQGCVMSGFLFLLVIDWTMTTTTKRRRGINWGRLQVLEDLDYADDLALLSATGKQLQLKTNELVRVSARVGLQVNTKKSKVMSVSPTTQQVISINGEELENVSTFTYLGSEINCEESSTADINCRIGKARSTFTMMRAIWASNQYSRGTKLRLYKSNVLSVLLYGAECWKVNKRDGDRLNAFHNRCLRRILKIFWPRIVTNVELHRQAGMPSATSMIRARRWEWIGHVLRKESSDDKRIALSWSPPGKRSRGRPKDTWRRMVEKERIEFGWSSWADVQLAKDRTEWRSFVRALCATGRGTDL